MADMTLNQLREGQHAVVDRLCAEGSMRRRLQDIGIISGTKVECVLKSPANDPCAYLIRGAVIALRNEDAGKVAVRLEAEYGGTYCSSGR